MTWLKLAQVLIVYILILIASALMGEKVPYVNSMILLNVLMVSRIVWDMKKEE